MSSLFIMAASTHFRLNGGSSRALVRSGRGTSSRPPSPPAVRSLEAQPLRRRRLETPRELDPACHRLAHPAPHVLPDRPDKLPILPELAVEPGRGHFEVVRLRQKTRHVQHIARFMTE